MSEVTDRRPEETHRLYMARLIGIAEARSRKLMAKMNQEKKEAETPAKRWVRKGDGFVRRQ